MASASASASASAAAAATLAHLIFDSEMLLLMLMLIPMLMRDESARGAFSQDYPRSLTFIRHSREAVANYCTLRVSVY
jgi:hypothetical protein